MYLYYYIYICIKIESFKIIDYVIIIIFCLIDILFNMIYKFGVKYNYLIVDCICNL